MVLNPDSLSDGHGQLRHMKYKFKQINNFILAMIHPNMGRPNSLRSGARAEDFFNPYQTENNFPGNKYIEGVSGLIL